MDDCCSRKSATLNVLAQGNQRRVLVIVIAVNIVMFAAEFGFGLVAPSSAMAADVIANAGVLVAAALVAATGKGWPDMAAGAVIAILFLRSAARVLRSAWPVWRGHGGKVELD